jgi:hypothetical protein
LRRAEIETHIRMALLTAILGGVGAADAAQEQGDSDLAFSARRARVLATSAPSRTACATPRTAKPMVHQSEGTGKPSRISAGYAAAATAVVAA